MPVVILKKSIPPSIAITPSIDCDAVEERLRDGASPSSVSVEEYEAMGRRDAIKKKELIHRGSDARHNTTHLTPLA